MLNYVVTPVLKGHSNERTLVMGCFLRAVVLSGPSVMKRYLFCMDTSRKTSFNV